MNCGFYSTNFHETHSYSKAFYVNLVAGFIHIGQEVWQLRVAVRLCF